MKYCGKCGSELDAETSLCPKCDNKQTKNCLKPNNKKLVLIPIIVLLICAIAFGVLFVTVFFSGSKQTISEGDAQKMVDLIKEIGILEDNQKGQKEIKEYLSNLDWIKSVSETDDGGLNCRTEFGVTGVWTPKSEEMKGSETTGNFVSDSHIIPVSTSKSLNIKNIVVLCPYASSGDSAFIPGGYEFLGNQTAKSLNCSVKVFNDQDVSLELLKSIDQYDIVLYDAHGTLSNVLNSAWAVVNTDPFVLTGEFADSKIEYITLSEDFYNNRTVVNLSNGRIGVGGKFFQHYYSEGQLDNMFFHFGACNSMKNDTLADGLISRGAVWVEGWSNSVNTRNDFCQLTRVLNSLIDGETVQQAIIDADEKVKKEYPEYYQDDCKLKGKGNGNYKLESKNKSTINIEEELEKAFRGTLSGKVVSSKDNKTLADVDIIVYKSNDSNKKEIANSFTDKDGNFEISLSAGEYDFEFTKKGYLPHTTGFKIEKGVINVLKDNIVLEAKTVDFVNNKYLVKCDDVIYGVDVHGLWKNEGGYNKEYLTKCSATNLTTDGQVIYYSVQNNNTTNQYDLYQYDIETGSNEKVTSFVQCGVPIFAEGEMIYYTDFPESSNVQGMAHSLYSYNTSTGEKKHLADGAQLVGSYDGKIFYRDVLGGVPSVNSKNKWGQIYCYDTKTEESKMISDGGVMSFKIESGKLLYNTLLTDTGNSRTVKVNSYDISSGNTEVLFEKTKKSVEVKDYDEKYIVYSETRVDGSGFIRLEIKTGKEDLLPRSKFNGELPTKAMRDSDRTIFYTDNTGGIVYTMEDSGTILESTNSSYIWQTMLAIKKDTVFAITNDSKNYYEYYISCGRAS